jgi:hypothetical protein
VNPLNYIAPEIPRQTPEQEARERQRDAPADPASIPRLRWTVELDAADDASEDVEDEPVRPAAARLV